MHFKTKNWELYQKPENTDSGIPFLVVVEE